jgi:4-hydroxy-3-polyprenylbenzoate decarboxylase
VLLRANRSVYLTISPAAAEVYSQEIGGTIHLKQFVAADYLGRVSQELDLSLLKYQHYQDFRSGIASGSFLTAGMVICPCSLGTVAAVAQGTSSNLIHRAADVHLKERRKLILVPRETPLGIVQLRNLLAVAEAGAVVLPAMPALYTHPQSIQDMIDFIVGRICDQLGVFHQLFRRWGSA